MGGNARYYLAKVGGAYRSLITIGLLLITNLKTAWQDANFNDYIV